MAAQARTATGTPEALHDLAEEGAEQAKENLETMRAAAGEATNLLKHNYATTMKGTQDYSVKILEFTNANIAASVEALHALARHTPISETCHSLIAGSRAQVTGLCPSESCGSQDRQNISLFSTSRRAAGSIP
jgi:hypothetical protein